MTAKERSKLLVMLTQCRHYVDDVLPPTADLTKPFGFSGSWGSRLNKSLERAKLLGIRRVAVEGQRAPFGPKQTAYREVQRLKIVWVATDAEFDAVYPLDLLDPPAKPRPLPKRNYAPGDLARAKIMAMARLCMAKGAMLPTWAVVAEAIGLTHHSARRHLEALVRSGRLVVRRIEQPGPHIRLAVVSVSPSRPVQAPVSRG